MAAPGITQLTGNLGSWLGSTFLWVGILLAFGLVFFGFSILRKRRKLKYQCLELVRYGEKNEKYGFNNIKCGWFGAKKILFGLWDTGPQVMKTKSGEEIVGFSTDDYQEINGTRGVVVFRDPINQDILVPINKVNVKGTEMLATIAPQDFRDVAVKLMNDAEIETQDRITKLAQIVIIGLIVIAAFISIILIIQYAKHVTDSGNEALTTASTTCLQNAKTICGQIASQFASTPSQQAIVTASTAP